MTKEQYKLCLLLNMISSASDYRTAESFHER